MLLHVHGTPIKGLTSIFILLKQAVVFDWVERELSTGDVGMVLVVALLVTKPLPAGTEGTMNKIIGCKVCVHVQDNVIMGL